MKFLPLNHRLSHNDRDRVHSDHLCKKNRIVILQRRIATPEAAV
jgi:hypothetical protein